MKINREMLCVSYQEYEGSEPYWRYARYVNRVRTFAVKSSEVLERPMVEALRQGDLDILGLSMPEPTGPEPRTA